MVKRLFALLIALAVSFSASADQTNIRAFVDASCAAEARDYAVNSKALFAEWYPKINEILFGADHPLPQHEILVVLEPDLQFPAFATGSQVHADCGYIKQMPDGYPAMMIHELVHIVQSYPAKPAETRWIVEGIADYVRHKYYEKDISPTLRIDHEGRLYGYGDREPYFQSLQTNRVDLSSKGYLQSYTVASSFLFWLETKKDKQIVRELNLAFSQGQYSPELFQKHCGKPLDDLWAEFVAYSKAH